MILLDTSVWADHFRHENQHIQQLLAGNQVVMHSMVAGELACGYLNSRKKLLTLWQSMPQATEANNWEVITLIENNQLMGRGVGFIDFHLLASCLLSANTQLWTHDKRLHSVAEELNIAYLP